MTNNISLQPNPVTVSYVKQFQVAQFNFHLYIEEERQRKKKHKATPILRVS
jgi:hypothetical protein